MNENEKSLQIVDKKNLGLSLIEINAAKAIEIANNRVEFFKQMKTVSLKMTSHQDWVDQSGKPYLQGSGVEKLKPVWGIYIKDDVKIEQIPDGDRYYCRCTGTAGSKVTGEESFFIGGRSANDKFFSNQAITDPMDVEKAAYTNFEVNAITRLLGLRGLTWDELTDADIQKGKTTKIGYGKGRQGGQTVPQELITLRTEITNAILEYVGGDIEAADQMLQNFSGTDNIANIKDIDKAKSIINEIKQMKKKETE